MQIYQHRDTIKLYTPPTDSAPDTAQIPVRDVPEVIQTLTALYREYVVKQLVSSVKDMVQPRTLEILERNLKSCNTAELKAMLEVHELDTVVAYDERIEEGTVMHSVLSSRVGLHTDHTTPPSKG
jgi:hypothetical protein